jgi:hypothetical protein
MADWGRLVAQHSAALQEFVLLARRVPTDRWNKPVAPGKWTPAEITTHLSESYQVLRGELAGRPGMQLRLSRLQRWVLRHTMLPRILASGKFPAAARAPKETRPREVQVDAAGALHRLSTEADAFVQELSDPSRRGARLTHAYFGAMSAQQSLRMVTVHTRHHARQLAVVCDMSGTGEPVRLGSPQHKH